MLIDMARSTVYITMNGVARGSGARAKLIGSRQLPMSLKFVTDDAFVRRFKEVATLKGPFLLRGSFAVPQRGMRALLLYHTLRGEYFCLPYSEVTISDNIEYGPSLTWLRVINGAFSAIMAVPSSGASLLTGYATSKTFDAIEAYYHVDFKNAVEGDGEFDVSWYVSELANPPQSLIKKATTIVGAVASGASRIAHAYADAASNAVKERINEMVLEVEKSPRAAAKKQAEQARKAVKQLHNRMNQVPSQVGPGPSGAQRGRSWM